MRYPGYPPCAGSGLPKKRRTGMQMVSIMKAKTVNGVLYRIPNALRGYSIHYLDRKGVYISEVEDQGLLGRIW